MGMTGGIMQVFLSYAESDLTLAKKVATGLQVAGFEVWYDDLYVFPGDNWGTAVGDALNKSHAMVALLTRDGLRSKKVSSETQFALGNKGYLGRLVPVIIGTDDEISREQVPWIFHHLHPIYIRTGDIETGIEQIIRALTSDIDPKFLVGVTAA
jgi:hypothetical protein